MRKAYGLLSVPISVALSFGIAGCADDNKMNPETAVDQAATAFGGKQALLGLKSQVTVVTGQRFEPGQAKSPTAQAVPLGDFEYTATQDLAADRLTVAWKRTSLLGTPLNYTEVLNRDLGYVNGGDAVTSMAPQAALLSARVAAVRKHQRLFQPHVLLARALQTPGDVSTLPNAQYKGTDHKVFSLKGGFQPTLVYVDLKTGLVSKVETSEDDPMKGDVLIEVSFSDYKAVSGVQVPHQISLSLAGTVVHTEKRTMVTLNGTLMDSTFVIPDAVKGMVDAGDAARGEAISEYLHRFLALGFPADFDASRSVMSSEISPGVWHVTGAGAHTLAISTDAGIVAVEAPGDDARSAAVIAEIKKKIPGKAITHIINTHHHDDHAGGLRTYVAEGATVVTGASNEAYFKTVFAAPHKLRPDTLQQKPAQAKIQTVSATPLEIKSGTRTIRVYTVANGHADGMLGVYVEDAKLFFVADLYSPGFFPADKPIEGPFAFGAKDLYKALTVDLKLDPSLKLVGAHGFGTATLATLKINAGM